MRDNSWKTKRKNMECNFTSSSETMSMYHAYVVSISRDIEIFFFEQYWGPCRNHQEMRGALIFSIKKDGIIQTIF